MKVTLEINLPDVGFAPSWRHGFNLDGVAKTLRRNLQCAYYDWAEHGVTVEIKDVVGGVAKLQGHRSSRATADKTGVAA